MFGALFTTWKLEGLVKQCIYSFSHFPHFSPFNVQGIKSILYVCVCASIYTRTHIYILCVCVCLCLAFGVCYTLFFRTHCVIIPLSVGIPDLLQNMEFPFKCFMVNLIVIKWCCMVVISKCIISLSPTMREGTHSLQNIYSLPFQCFSYSRDQHAGLAACFVNKVLLAPSHTHLFPIVYRHFHTTIAELSNCNRPDGLQGQKYLLFCSFQKTFAHPCSRGN